jgi:hypothetical protein
LRFKRGVQHTGDSFFSKLGYKNAQAMSPGRLTGR